jgi:hypothetical protein
MAEWRGSGGGWQNFGQSNPEWAEAFYLEDLLTWGIINDIYEQLADRYRDIWLAYASAVRNKEPAVLSQIAELNAAIAKESQVRILEAYQNSPYIDKAHPYRFSGNIRFRRYSKGLMVKALSDKRLITSDSEGIHFIDQSILDSQAKQWRRLNFGASPKGAKQVDEGFMSFFGQTTSASVNLNDQRPSARFKIPGTLARGFFANQYAADNLTDEPFTALPPSSARKGDAFYIFVKGYTHISNFKTRAGTNHKKANFLFKQRWARGIYGSSFLEEGARYINDELPRGLERIALELYEGAFAAMHDVPAQEGQTLKALEPVIGKHVREVNAVTAARNARAAEEAAAAGYPFIKNRYQWMVLRQQLNARRRFEG